MIYNNKADILNISLYIYIYLYRDIEFLRMLLSFQIYKIPDIKL